MYAATELRIVSRRHPSRKVAKKEHRSCGRMTLIVAQPLGFLLTWACLQICRSSSSSAEQRAAYFETRRYGNASNPGTASTEPQSKPG